MSTKRGRKCSIRGCDNFQHTHKHLSFFRFPKDIERCRIWIEKAQRFDLLNKTNVHDERICQQHFEEMMFLNESKNRLQPFAIPTLHLVSKPPPIQMPSVNVLKNGFADDEFTFNDPRFNMGMISVDAAAALLQQNNLTITPVYAKNSKQIQSSPVKAQPILAEPLNLSTSAQNPNNIKSLPTNNIDVSIKLHSVVPTVVTNKNRDEVKPVNSAIPATTNTVSNGDFRRPRQIFTMQQENELAHFVRETSNYYSGISSKEVRILAFVYGVCNQVEMPIGWRESHQASFDWIVGFMKRTKLPSTIITGIAMNKGKQSKSPTSNGQTKSNHIEKSQHNGNSNICNDINGNITPIDID